VHYSSIGCGEKVGDSGFGELSGEDLDSGNGLAVNEDGVTVYSVFHK
jgi:hypothetical protein